MGVESEVEEEGMGLDELEERDVAGAPVLGEVAE